MTLIKSISGIRGTIGGNIGDALTPIDIVKFTSAYATELRKRLPGKDHYRVVVGRDARISGQMVENLVCGTLLACGIDVIDAGLASTPTTEMAVILRRQTVELFLLHHIIQNNGMLLNYSTKEVSF